MTSYRVLVLAALSITLVHASSHQGPPSSSQTHFSSSPDCLDSATVHDINTLLRTGGEGATVALCPFAQVSIDPSGKPITFTAARQSIFTQGYPEDHSRATIAIESDHAFGDLTTAIKADCDACRGVSIKALHIDGGREQLGGVEGGNALILVGGKVGEQEVRHVDAYNARGYAIIHASGEFLSLRFRSFPPEKLIVFLAFCRGNKGNMYWSDDR